MSIRITVEVDGEKAEQQIDGLGARLLLDDVVPKLRGPQDSEKLSPAMILLRVIDASLKACVKQTAKLW